MQNIPVAQLHIIFKLKTSFLPQCLQELALLRDSTRAATITCREDCELLTIDKEVFAMVCPAIFEEELREKLQFVR